MYMYINPALNDNVASNKSINQSDNLPLQVSSKSSKVQKVQSTIKNDETICIIKINQKINKFNKIKHYNFKI